MKDMSEHPIDIPKKAMFELCQADVQAWFAEKGWDYWEPKVVCCRFEEEKGEFSRAMNDQFGKKKKRPEELKQDTEKELGDMIWTLCCFANPHGIMLDALAIHVEDEADPILLMARLSKASGDFADTVYIMHKEPEFAWRPLAEEQLSAVISVIYKFAEVLGFDAREAFIKAHQKVMDRDKDRYTDATPTHA